MSDFTPPPPNFARPTAASFVVNTVGHQLLGRNLLDFITGTINFINLTQRAVELPGYTLPPVRSDQVVLNQLANPTRSQVESGDPLSFKNLPPIIFDTIYLVEPELARQGFVHNRVDLVAVTEPRLKLRNLCQTRVDYTTDSDLFFSGLNPDPGPKPYVANFEDEPNNFCVYDLPPSEAGTILFVPWCVALVGMLSDRVDLVGVTV